MTHMTSRLLCLLTNASYGASAASDGLPNIFPSETALQRQISKITPDNRQSIQSLDMVMKAVMRIIFQGKNDIHSQFGRGPCRPEA